LQDSFHRRPIAANVSLLEDPPAATAAPPKEVADCHQHLPVDPAATGTPLREVVVDSGETVLLSLSPGTAATVLKRKAKRKQWNLTAYKKRKETYVRTIYITCRHNDDDDDDDNDNHNYVNDDGCRSLGCLFQRECPFACSKEDGKATVCQTGCRQNS
jgi:hypothetical protein